MPLHILKLCVGVEDAEMLKTLQKARLREEDGLTFVPGFTRRRPRRAAEIIEDGSIYWIIRGVIQVRQRILDMVDAVDDDGSAYCQFRFEPILVTVEPRAHRPFQGWRYLTERDAPADNEGREGDEFPPEMAAELRFLGLL
ncbi:MAG: DUF1489 domain-containing protein [Pseudomonadota bacterium]